MSQEVKDFFTKLDKLDDYWQKIEWFNLKYDNPELYSRAIKVLNNAQSRDE